MALLSVLLSPYKGRPISGHLWLIGHILKVFKKWYTFGSGFQWLGQWLVIFFFFLSFNVSLPQAYFDWVQGPIVSVLLGLVPIRFGWLMKSRSVVVSSGPSSLHYSLFSLHLSEQIIWLFESDATIDVHVLRSC